MKPIGSLTFAAVLLAIFALTSVSYAKNTQPTNVAAQGSSKPQAAVLVAMTECEGINNCATWTFLGGLGNGQWPSGEVANLSVEHFDADTVVIRRADSTGSSAGLTAVYKGTRHGDRIGGEFTSSWPGHWDDKSGNWYATIGKTVQGPPSVMRVCDPNVTCGTWTWNDGHYDGVWIDGITATLTVESFTPESVIIKRIDSGPSHRVGLTYVYTGKISSQGDRVLNGVWTGEGGTGHFSAIWGAALRDQLAAGNSAQPQPRVIVPVVCFPWFFSVVCE